MLKIIFLLIIPGFLAEFWRRDFHQKEKSSYGKSVANGFWFSYLLFLLDITIFLLFGSDKYTEFLSFLQRNMQTVQDLFEFLILEFVQILLASCIGLLIRIVEWKGLEKCILRMTAFQCKTGWAVIGCLLLATVSVYVVKDNVEHRLVINEVCSHNNRTMADENGEYSDYVELYNPSRQNILLEGFRISDSPDGKDGIAFDDVIIPAKSYYLVWVDESADFGISSKGENIYLTNRSGELLDSIVVPKLDADISYARTTDGVAEWSEEVPSPLAENNPLKKYLKEPVFSAESGFYDEAFMLEIKGNEGEKIYYTLDSSIPDVTSNLYTEQLLIQNISANPNAYRNIQNKVRNWLWEPIVSEPVDKAFIVRAIAVDDYGNTSDVVTKTYFVDMNQYKDRYVLSLVSDPDDLFGDNGIYVTGKEYDDWYLGGQEGAEPTANFLKKGKEYEINTTVALFCNDMLMEQDAGLRIQGASQRHPALKRFSVYARKEYSGSRFFDYDLFGKKIHSFFMRSDFIDAAIHNLVSDRNIGGLQAKAVSVFLDGEYWYDSILREKYNEDYLSATFGVERKDVVLTEGVPEEIYKFLAEHDLSQESDYEKFGEVIDIQSYIDYTAANIYMCNMDSSESRNCKLWKTQINSGQEYSDGKWRWLIYDTDSVEWNSIGYYGTVRYNIDSFAQDKEYAGVAYNQETIYKALKANKDFCRQFVLTFMDLANVNFTKEKVAEELAVWGVEMSWNDSFFENRFDSIVPALAKEFKLTGSLEEITIRTKDTDAGIVKINTVMPELIDGSWTGKYYTDYPVTVTAMANEGYEFVGWTNGIQTISEAQISVQLEAGGCTWEAVFEKKEK